MLLPSPSREAKELDGVTPSTQGESHRPSRQPYLIVFTRHPGTDASARYLLRHAAQLARAGHPMTLYLTGAAACADGAASARAPGISSVYLLVDGESTICDETDDCQYRTASQLSALMLQPGWQIYWC